MRQKSLSSISLAIYELVNELVEWSLRQTLATNNQWLLTTNHLSNSTLTQSVPAKSLMFHLKVTCVVLRTSRETLLGTNSRTGITPMRYDNFR